MKKLLISLLAMALSLAAFSQQTVDFEKVTGGSTMTLGGKTFSFTQPVDVVAEGSNTFAVMFTLQVYVFHKSTDAITINGTLMTTQTVAQMVTLLQTTVFNEDTGGGGSPDSVDASKIKSGIIAKVHLPPVYVQAPLRFANDSTLVMDSITFINLTHSGNFGPASLVSLNLNIPDYSDLIAKVNDSLKAAIALKLNITDTSSASTNDDITTKAWQALGSPIKAQSLGAKPQTAVNNGSLNSGTIIFTATYLPKNATVTGVKWSQATAGAYTADASNLVGLYSYSAGTLTRVAVSTDDGTIWKTSSFHIGSKAFSSTYSAPAGVYFIAILYHTSAQTTQPVIYSAANEPYGNTNILDFTNGAMLAGTLAGQTTLPTTQAMSGLTVSGQNMWLAIY